MERSPVLREGNLASAAGTVQTDRRILRIPGNHWRVKPAPLFGVPQIHRRCWVERRFPGSQPAAQENSAPLLALKRALPATWNTGLLRQFRVCNPPAPMLWTLLRRGSGVTVTEAHCRRTLSGLRGTLIDLRKRPGSCELISEPVRTGRNQMGRPR